MDINSFSLFEGALVDHSMGQLHMYTSKTININNNKNNKSIFSCEQAGKDYFIYIFLYYKCCKSL